MRDHMAEVQYVKDTMLRRKIVVGFVPYGQVLHIWRDKRELYPLCGHSRRNKERPVSWSGGICTKCLRRLGYKEHPSG